MRLTAGGVLIYAGTAVLLAVQAVRLLLMETLWAEGVSLAPTTLVVVTAAAALLFVAGAVTRRPLVGGDGTLRDAASGGVLGPWFSSVGWAVVGGLTAVGLAVVLMASYDEVTGIWVTGPAVFVPFWVRTLEESYREGTEEADR